MMHLVQRCPRLVGYGALNATRYYATASKKGLSLSSLEGQDKMRALRLIRSPWLARGQGALCTRPSLLYAQRQFQRCRGSTKRRSPLVLLHRFGREYEKLSASQKRPFEARAERHRKLRNADRKMLKGLRGSPYGLFMKKHYASAAAKVAHIQDPSKRMRAIARAVATKWKKAGRAERKALESLCARQRTSAFRKLIHLVQKMKAAQRK